MEYQPIIKCTDPFTRIEIYKICGLICICEKNPVLGKRNKKNKEGGVKEENVNLKQLCVDKGLESFNRINETSKIVGSPPYLIDETNTAIPIFPTFEDVCDASWRRVIYASRLIKSVDKNEDMRNLITKYLHGDINSTKFKSKVKFKDDMKLPYKYNTGDVCIPDAVIMKSISPVKSLDPSNIAAVIEIKFPPDPWHGDQQKKYPYIAGGDQNKFEQLNPINCMCNLPELERDPVLNDSINYAAKLRGMYNEDTDLGDAVSTTAILARLASIAKKASIPTNIIDMVLTPSTIGPYK